MVVCLLELTETSPRIEFSFVETLAAQDVELLPVE